VANEVEMPVVFEGGKVIERATGADERELAISVSTPTPSVAECVGRATGSSLHNSQKRAAF
jgi:hypothetical protein